MKLQKYLVFTLAVICLLLTACQPPQIASGTTAPQLTSPTTAPTTEATHPTEETQPTEATQPTQSTDSTKPTEDPRPPLSDAEITQLQSFFEWPKDPENRYPKAFYHIALGQTYADPAEIDLFLLFYHGDETPWTETDAEKALINSSIKDGEFMDHFRAAPENMDSILKMCFGLTLAETKKTGLPQFVYSKDTGCYYTATTSPAWAVENLKIIGGFHQDNGDLEVTYTTTGGTFVMKLRPVEGSYHILSNQKA